MYPLTPDNPSLGSLSTEIDNIYKNYATNGGDLARSLDSTPDEPTYVSSPYLSVNLHADEDHRASSNLGGQSAPGTPASSSSFDFNSVPVPQGYTNSSLNVLVDTPSTESAYRLLISSAPLINSGRPGSTNARKGSFKELDDTDGDSRDEEIDVIEEPSSDAVSGLGTNESKDEWVEKGAAERIVPGEVSAQVIRRTVEDFEFGRDLGEGSYSTVVLATDKITGKKYAVKILDKRHIIKEKKVKYVNIEKHALNRLSKCPGIISLFFTFQDKHSLYFVLDFASNGELLNLIKKYGTLNEDCAKHLSAQILSAMKHMHNHGVIHRDIKPENILLDDKFRIKITDFGTAKLLEKRKKNESEEEEEYPVDVRAKSFVGTAEYVSPELLDSKYCGKPGDIWAFGCILYQMIAGKPPFKAPNEYLTFQKITKLQYAFSAGFPLILRDLIKQILVLQPSRRATIEQIQKHYFYNDIDFSDDALIWSAELPELGPYKASAKSMMKMPAQAKSNVKQYASTNKKPTGRQNKASSKRKVEGADGSKGFSAASVAALVLDKSEDDHEQERKQKPSPASGNNSSKTQTAPEYIPGTNILRPTIHTMASFSRKLSHAKSEADVLKKPKSRVMSVKAVSAVEVAWQKFLQSPSERILNVGHAVVSKQPSDFFERRNRGLIHDAPLGLVNKLQAMDNRDSGNSMLSQIAQGSRALRESTSSDASPKPSVKLESSAITYFVEEEESGIDSIPEDQAAEASPSTHSKLGKGLFKKLLSHSDKKQEASSDNHSTSSSGSGTNSRRTSLSLDKGRNCTIIVTTHGRLLILTREDPNAEYKLIVEVRLNYPFIKFKEIVSNTGSKFSKFIPSTGTFAVQALQTVFIFEVEKYEVNKWTEALAKSKINQYERDYEDEARRRLTTLSLRNSDQTDSTVGNSNSASKAQSSTPADSSSEKVSDRYQATPSSPGPPLSNVEQKERLQPLMPSKWKNRRSTKKRPPPPPLSPSGLGLEGERGEISTVHAAQLAVSQSNYVMTENRRSSFSREGRREPTPPSSYRLSSTQSPRGIVTSLNSKFLARSRGKK